MAITVFSNSLRIWLVDVRAIELAQSAIDTETAMSSTRALYPEPERATTRIDRGTCYSTSNEPRQGQHYYAQSQAKTVSGYCTALVEEIIDREVPQTATRAKLCNGLIHPVELFTLQFRTLSTVSEPILPRRLYIA